MPLTRIPLDLEVCPLRPEAGLLGKKWTLPILRDVYALRAARFSEILHRNEGLSDRLLSLRLRELSREGLVERHVGKESPPTVTYSLTGIGGAAIRVVEAFVNFGVQTLATQIYSSPSTSASP